MSDGLDRTLTSPNAGRSSRGAPRLGLRVVHPSALARWIDLAPKGWTEVGRAHGLDHPTVSRHHLSLRRAGLVVEVKDEQSHNGTWLQGARLDQTPALGGAGSVLRIGDVLAVIEAREEDDEAVDHEALPGDAPSVRAARHMLGRVAPGTAHLLLLGETGTGKELAAREVHRLSGRDVFVAFNCAGLAPQLADSQLFGHVKGAFTGADGAREGLFRSAHNGTLFLDEVAELAPEVQAKLLRVLETGEVQPLGSDAIVRADVRVIAATQPDLDARVRDGRFRRDLHARLSLASVTLPPLRERRGDIPAWLERLEAAWREREAGEPLVWTPAALERAMLAPWESNLRGVDRVVYQLRAKIGPGGAVDLEALNGLLDVGETPSAAAAPPTARPDKPSREELAQLLTKLGSVRATAKHLRRDRKQIYRWMEAYGLNED